MFSRKNLSRLAVALVVVLALGYAGISVYMADKLTSATHTPTSTLPSDYGAAYETVRFPSAVDGIPLEGWYIDSPGKRVILLLHANGGVRDCVFVGLGDIAKGLWQNGFDVLAFDLRAHGKSGGDRVGFGGSEVRDVAGAVAYLKTRGVNQVGAMGFSLGADTALIAAPDIPELRAIVADSAFADLPLVLETELPKASGLPAFFNPGVILAARLTVGLDASSISPRSSVARLGDRPLFLIHGALDSTVNVSQAYTLQKAAAANPNMQSWVVADAEHARAFKQHPEEFITRTVAFYNRYLP
jgi:dienelactone hydrolase